MGTGVTRLFPCASWYLGEQCFSNVACVSRSSWKAASDWEFRSWVLTACNPNEPAVTATLFVFESRFQKQLVSLRVCYEGVFVDLTLILEYRSSIPKLKLGNPKCSQSQTFCVVTHTWNIPYLTSRMGCSQNADALEILFKNYFHSMHVKCIWNVIEFSVSTWVPPPR